MGISQFYKYIIAYFSFLYKNKIIEKNKSFYILYDKANGSSKNGC